MRTRFLVQLIVSLVAIAAFFAYATLTPTPIPDLQPPSAASSIPPSPADTAEEAAPRPPLPLRNDRRTADPAPAPSPAAYSIPILSTTTVLDAMRAHAAGSGFSFDGREYPGLGFFVQSLGGVAGEDGAYWFLYVNGEKSGTGASQTLVKPGDRVEWKLENSY